MMKYSERAKSLFDSDYEPIPIAPGKKYPTLQGWRTVELPIRPWPENHGIGLRCGSISAIDMDVNRHAVAVDLLHCFDGLEILTRVGQPPKTLIPVICPEVTRKLLSDQWVDNGGGLNRIEILSYGEQFVASAFTRTQNVHTSGLVTFSGMICRSLQLP